MDEIDNKLEDNKDEETFVAVTLDDEAELQKLERSRAVDLSATDKNVPKNKHTFFIILVCIVGVLGVTFGIAAIIGGWSAVKTTSEFITRQILGMSWLNEIIGLALAGIGGEAFIATWYGAGIQFFIYDTIKIIILLCLLIFLISYIQSYFPPKRTKILI